jgi:malate dehydrogenase
MVASGLMLGPNQKIVLALLDIEPALPMLEGVVMEVNDGAYPLVTQIIATADPREALRDVDVAVFVGGFPRKQGMERKELLEKNMNIFKA